MAPRLPRLLRRLVALFTWHRRDQEMSEEMSFHVEAMTRDYVGQGMSAADARAAAHARFGSLLRLKEQGHDVRRPRLLEELARDVRHTSRGLRKSRGFSLAVVATLALAIGGNTAIFSVIDQLLLRPLPYPDGDRLVTVYEKLPNVTGAMLRPDRNVASPANWLDWQRESRTLQRLAAWLPFSMTLTDAGAPVRLDAQLVTAEFFPVLGVPPLLGRTLTAADDRPDAPQVVVISHRLWRQRFAGDARVIGRSIRLGDRPVEVVGVMPSEFRFIYHDVDLWAALRLNRTLPFRERAGRYLNVVGRLAPGVALGDARREMEGIAARLAALHPFNRNSSVTLVPLREELTGQVASALMVLYAAVAVLLAIACFNVANLLLARAASRRRELAIRASLGAGRVAIIRQLVVESLLLAIAGGAVGIALARWSLDTLVAVAPPELLRVPDLHVDTRVLLYTAALSLVTGVSVGLMPAILVSRGPLAAALAAGRATRANAPRVRQLLVVGQVAMTVILLCGAALLLRTVLELNNAPSGFDKRGLLTMEIGLPPRYEPEQRTTFYRDVARTLRALPGVRSAAAANSLAVIGSPRGGTGFHRRGTPPVPLTEQPSTGVRVVTPGYFRTMGVPIVRGREFAEADDSVPNVGFVVNEAFARAYLGDVDPLTASISVYMQRENPYLPIIGVVGDISEGSIRDVPKPTVFYNHRTMPEARMTLFVRADRPEALATAAVNAVRQIDDRLPVTDIQTFESALADSIAQERVSAIVTGGLALSGLFLAAFGLYGLLAFLVTERTKEIGIRIALGARLRTVSGSIVAGGLRLVAIGAALGIAGSWLLLPPLQLLLFGVTPRDMSTYALVVGLICVVTALAAYVPARSAARVEPLVALRQD